MMTKDEKEWLEALVKDAAKHTEPSHETVTLITNLEKNMNRIEKQQEKYYGQLLDELKGFKRYANKTFAGKNVERVIYSAVGMVLAYFFGGLLGLFGVPAVKAFYNLLI